MTRRFDAAVPYCIAEIGVNHDGSVARAHDMLDAAGRAGFDAVKFQYWILDELLADNAPAAPYQGTTDQHTLLRDLRLDLNELARLRSHAHDLGMDFIVTPDGRRACADLASLELDAIKIGSADADNPWLVEAVANTATSQCLPVIASTGMMSDGEVRALSRLLSGVDRVVVLHCVTAYPTAIEHLALGRMARLRAISGRPVGFSDHTIGIAAAAAAVALGAVAIEKHVTWSVSAPGPDHRASLALDDAGEWVATLRHLAAALREETPSPDEHENRGVVRKALYSSRALTAGSVLLPGDLVPLRPLGTGIGAGERDVVVGRRLRRDIDARTPIAWSDLEAD